MSKLKDLYRKSDWYTVFHFEDDRGKARSNLLFASITQTVISGLTTGVFYSGYLSTFGINIVSISVLTLIPYVTSFLSMLAPVILERFKKRRKVLTVARLLYYTINILGPTLLPLLIADQGKRLAGMVVLVFLANAINALFSSGYSAWHMGYIDPEIRSAYMTACNIISTAVSGILMLSLGAVTDQLEGPSQQVLLAAFRCGAFALALLDTYFMQKPREPEYKTGTGTKISLVSTFRIPLSNKRFMLIMSVYALHQIVGCLINSVVNTWLLESVNVSYAYISFINMTPIFFMLPTSALWGRFVRRHGNLSTLALMEGIQAMALLAHAFMTESNYLWVMTIVKLIQNCIYLGVNISVSSLIYIALPEEDRTSYLSFYQILSNVTLLLSLSIGTWVVAAMGDRVVTILGYSFASVPLLFLIQTIGFLILPVYVRWVGKKVEPEGWVFHKGQYHIPFLHRNHPK